MAAIAAESLLVHGGLVSGYRVMFYLPFIWKLPLPEIWRLITPFLLTSGGFNAMWDMYMFWTYATQLELNSSRFSQPGDFATYVGFVAVSILVSGFVVSFIVLQTSHFCPVRNLCLISVPGSEGRLPLRDMLSYHSQKYKKGCMWRRHGGSSLEKLSAQISCSWRMWLPTSLLDKTLHVYATLYIH